MKPKTPVLTPILDRPSDSERSAILGQFFADQRKVNAEGRTAVLAAAPALTRLCAVMRNRTGQSYTVRALLYSLYNGQETSVLEIVTLDRAIRGDLCAVLLAFGFEGTEWAPTEGGEKPSPGVSFFYDEMKAEVSRAGLWDWFVEAHKEDAE